MIDLGTGNNNKINWPMEDKQEMIDIIETVYRGASKGRGWVATLSDENRCGECRLMLFSSFDNPVWSCRRETTLHV